MGIALKFYSCVGSNHTTLDAIRALQAEHPFGPGDVERIVVHGSQVTVDHAGWTYRPEGVTSAQLNLSFCVATLLLEGDVFVDQFSDAVVADPQRLALAGKVDVRHDPAITALGSQARHTVRVAVHLTDGTRLERSVEAARGSERSFASEAEIVAKFRKLAGKVFDAPRLDRIVETVLGADKLENAGELPRLLRRD